MGELSGVIQEIGGGLAAVVIVALALANVAQYRRNNKVMDDRIADQKEHAGQLIENARTLDNAIKALSGGRNV